MAATIKDVARASGVSAQTVWRILNGKNKNNNENTAQRVVSAADELGYRANSSAKAMRSGRFGSVALLLSEYSGLSLLPVERREGIQDVLGEQEINLILSRFSNDALTNQERLPRILREIMADGLLINYNANLPQPMVDIISQYQIPAVWINSRQPADCVYPDDRDAGRGSAAKRLLTLGHRRIGFAYAAPTSHYSFAERIAGYEEVMQESRHLPTRLVPVPVDLTGHDAVLKATSFMDERKCRHRIDSLCTGAADRAADRGLACADRNIPEEIAFVAVNDQIFIRAPGNAGGHAVTPRTRDGARRRPNASR